MHPAAVPHHTTAEVENIGALDIGEERTEARPLRGTVDAFPRSFELRVAGEEIRRVIDILGRGYYSTAEEVSDQKEIVRMSIDSGLQYVPEIFVRMIFSLL